MVVMVVVLQKVGKLVTKRRNTLLSKNFQSNVLSKIALSPCSAVKNIFYFFGAKIQIHLKR